jgi:hypothetical protein
MGMAHDVENKEILKAGDLRSENESCGRRFG